MAQTDEATGHRGFIDWLPEGMVSLLKATIPTGLSSGSEFFPDSRQEIPFKPSAQFSDLRPPVLKQGWPQEGPELVTKGNKKFAGTAEIREVERRQAKDRRTFIYLPQREIEAVLGVVRDTGFEPVTSCV